MRKYKVKLSEKIIITIFVVAVIFILYKIISFVLSVSTKPEYYTFEEIDEYVDDVFGEDCIFIESSSKYDYIYEDENGIRFTVGNSPDAVLGSIDGAVIPLFRKAVTDDYVESAVNFHYDKIKEIAKNENLEITRRHDAICIAANDKSQIESAAKAITDIFSLFNFNFDYDDGSLHKLSTLYPLKMDIVFYIIPDNADEYWAYNYDYHVSQFELYPDKDDSLDYNDILKSINESAFTSYRSLQSHTDSGNHSAFTLYNFP